MPRPSRTALKCLPWRRTSFEKIRIVDLGAIAGSQNQIDGLGHIRRWNQNVDIDADPGRGIAIQRLRQGDALQRNHPYAGFAEDAEQPRQFLRQQLVAQGVGHELALQFGPDRLGDAGESQVPQVAIEQRVNLVAVGVFQNYGPAQRGREESLGPGPLRGSQLSAGKQQTELVLGTHARAGVTQAGALGWGSR